jgi:hypothetical protein
MMRRLFCLVAIASLAIAAGIRAQSPVQNDKPVWTMEFLKVKPGKFGMALGYLDDNWVQVREVAKRQGAVLSYSRISEKDPLESERNIVLLTEYKNQAAYDGRDSLFEKIRKELPNTAAVMRNGQPGDLYVTGATRVFEDYSDDGDPRMKLLAQQ